MSLLNDSNTSLNKRANRVACIPSAGCLNAFYRFSFTCTGFLFPFFLIFCLVFSLGFYFPTRQDLYIENGVLIDVLHHWNTTPYTQISRIRGLFWFLVAVQDNLVPRHMVQCNSWWKAAHVLSSRKQRAKGWVGEGNVHFLVTPPLTCLLNSLVDESTHECSTHMSPHILKLYGIF